MDEADEFAADVRLGLSRPGQKALSPRYFYDEIGSALFEVIALLPEYGLSRAGLRLMRGHASAVAERLPPPVVVAELGSGSGRQARPLIEVLARRAPLTYCAIDVSPASLAGCADAAGIAGVRVVRVQDTYLAGLDRVVRGRTGEHVAVLFLGGTIGNFDRDEAARFLGSIRARLRPGDALLLGADLDKPAERLLPAYDDALGVTAAFNLNLLSRINRELGGDFDLRAFKHVVRWDGGARRIEMHLRSRRDQIVHVAAAGIRVELRTGETLWTESSYRYGRDELLAMGESAGFALVEQWVDDEWPFAQALLTAR
jgi:L-histidine Nalpha-methyltransferase